jgi:hypothetical protein
MMHVEFDVRFLLSATFFMSISGFVSVFPSSLAQYNVLDYSQRFFIRTYWGSACVWLLELRLIKLLNY